MLALGGRALSHSNCMRELFHLFPTDSITYYMCITGRQNIQKGSKSVRWIFENELPGQHYLFENSILRVPWWFQTCTSSISGRHHISQRDWMQISCFTVCTLPTLELPSSWSAGWGCFAQYPGMHLKYACVSNLFFSQSRTSNSTILFWRDTLVTVHLEHWFFSRPDWAYLWHWLKIFWYP